MKKKYVNTDVYTLAKDRIKYIFSNFERIYLSLSGGKDSTVCFHLLVDEAKKNKKKFSVLYIDTEAQYQYTIQHIQNLIEKNKDFIEEIFWVCLPMRSNNSLSYLEPTWIWWEEGKEAIWVREMPKNNYVINLEKNPIDFYHNNMTFEEFVKKFGVWFSKGKQTACIQGIRTDESLNRYRAIKGEKETHNDKIYSTRVSDLVYNFYPIYDWRVEDIWIYCAKYNKSYNKIYDLMYLAGVPLNKMRIDEPFGNEAKAGLDLFKVIEPDTWIKVVNRVSGANFGNIYKNSNIQNSNYKLPKNHTWKSFTKFLLNTLPVETKKHYTHKFIKFIRYWNKVGCPVSDEFINVLDDRCPNSIIKTNTISNRGKKDKQVVKFKNIPDEIQGIDTKQDLLCWKRLAMVIIKNDYICKSLSFKPTKEIIQKQKKLLEKYRNI